jgi:pimeloyl-ACP methyl ester carboxylesterase
VIAARAFARHAFTPFPCRLEPTGVITESMAHRSEFITVRGVRTHLMHGGRGEPILALHPEYGANNWHPYLDGLASRFRVVAPDHPGFGESERPDCCTTSISSICSACRERPCSAPRWAVGSPPRSRPRIPSA